MARKFESTQQKRTYQCWADMKSRCYNENHKRYKDYGGAGIGVCVAWKDSYEQFEADMGLKPDGLCLGRKDKNKNYQPSNCYWTTYKDNNRGKRASTMLTYKGKKKSIEDWAEEFNLTRTTLSNRIHGYKWPVDKALTAPIGHKENIPEDPKKAKYVAQFSNDDQNVKRVIAFRKKGWTMRDIGEALGVSETTVMNIIHKHAPNLRWTARRGY